MNKLIILFFLILVFSPENVHEQKLPILSCETGNAHAYTIENVWDWLEIRNGIIFCNTGHLYQKQKIPMARIVSTCIRQIQLTFGAIRNCKFSIPLF